MVVRHEVLSEFEEILRKQVAEASSARGCLKYEWYNIPGSLSQFIINAEFASHADYERYKASPATKSIEQQMISLLSTIPEIKRFPPQ